MFNLGFQWPNEPFVFVMKAMDIPATMLSAFLRLPPQCVAVALYYGWPKNMAGAEKAARKTGKRILWVKRGP